MAKVLVTESSLQDIADAIRTKNGSTDKYTPAEMSDAIEAIPTGITPTGTKQINITQNGATTEDVTNYANAQINVNVQSSSPTLVTKTIAENGTYDAEDDSADGYSSVTVNVPSSGYTGDDWLDLTKPVGDITYANALDSNKHMYALYYRTGLGKVSLPNTINVPDHFAHSASITDIDLPKATYFANNCLAYTKITYLIAPMWERFRQNCLLGCTNLLALDLGSDGSVNNGFSMGTTCSGCTKLATVVIRDSQTVAPLSNINVFTNTPFASNGAGGTLYVPSALIASYQAATNWSTILGYANNSIQAIEGSIYETQYVDGTPIAS